MRTPTSPWDYSSILTRSREERGSEAATEPDRDDQSTSSDPADRKAQRSHSVSGPLQDKVPELASTPRGAGMGPSAGPTSLPSSHEGWQSNHLYDGDISFEEADMPSMVDEAQFSAQESGIAPGEGRARRSSLPPSMSPEAPNSPALSPRSGSNGARPPGGPDLAEFVHNSPLRAQRRTIDALDNPQNTGKAPLLPTWQEASEGSVYDQTTARNLAAARGLGSDMEGVKVGGAPVSHGLGFDRQGAGRGTSPISHGPDLERARGTLLASYDLGTDVEGIQGTPPASYGYGSDWEGVRSNLPGSHGLKSDLQGSRSTPRVSYSRGSDVEGSRNPLDSYGVSMDQDGSLGPEVWSHPEGPKLFSDYRTGGGGQGTRPGWGRQDAASSFRGHGSSSDGQEGLDSDEPSSNSGSAWLQPFPEGSTLRRGEGPVARGAAALSPGSSAGTRWMSAEEFLSANDAAPSDRERSLPPPKAPSLPSPSLTAFEASGFPSVAGGELQELSEEERALESELSSIDQALRQRLSVPAAGSLSSAASLLLHQGDERQNRPSSNCSSGPTELLPGQARNNDMYVPSGGSGRWGGAGGGSLPDGPFPVSSDLWASRRSSSPAPEGGDAAPSQPAAGPYEWQGGRPRPATKGREDLDVRVAERMYAPAVEARQRLRSQREVIKREREEAAMSGCTFRPAICPRSAGIAGRAKGRGQGVWDVAPKEQRGRASSAPKERGPSPARWRRPGPGAVRSADPNWWRDFEHGLEAPAVRGFDLVQRGSDDYEAQLAASIARVGAQPPANLEVLSAVNNHVRAGQMSDPEDEDPGPQLRTCKPDEVVVTTACHRLYNQGLEHMVGATFPAVQNASRPPALLL